MNYQTKTHKQRLESLARLLAGEGFAVALKGSSVQAVRKDGEVTVIASPYRGCFEWREGKEWKYTWASKPDIGWYVATLKWFSRQQSGKAFNGKQ